MSADDAALLKEAEAFVVAKAEGFMTDWYQKGVVDGRSLERGRIYSILSHAAVLGREQMALQLAYFTDISVEAAVSQLEATLPLAVQLEN